jgi:hypothetical protein
VATRENPKYDWYQIVDGPDFTQGDVFDACPIPVPTPDRAFLEAAQAKEEPVARVNVLTTRLVVLTQACDIEQNKFDSIVLCPIFSLQEAAAQRTELASAGGRNKLREGKYFFLHLLNEDPEIKLDFGVVDFRVIYTLPTDFLKAFAEQSGARPRLLPPYREHLSQAFARYFMRVGLPLDIPAFA